MSMSSSTTVLLRVCFFLFLLICFQVLPWWIVFTLAATGTLAFSWYLESVLLMVYIDAVFAVGWIPWLGISMLLILLLVEFVTYYVSQ